MDLSDIFSEESKNNLLECDIRLQLVFNLVAKLNLLNIGIIEGHRPKEVQNKYFSEGKSKLQWPNSKHNKKPSQAVDVSIWLPEKQKYTWKEQQFIYLAGIVMSISKTLDIPIRWGGNWDQDFEVVIDQGFNDLGHFELDI